MTLNPWRLRLIDVFERHGTVRGVATELRLSPSTVSQQLSVLEAETGTRLFERSGRLLALTVSGELLVERARELRDHMESIEAELADVATGPAGRVRVAGFESSIAPLLIPAVARLSARHPRLLVELLEIEPRDAITALHQSRCDLVITVDEGDGALLPASITTIPLVSDPLVVVVPAAHPAASVERVSLSDLREERWSLDFPGSYLGELVPRECRRVGFEPTVVGRFSSYGALLAHVSAGLSIGILPELAVVPTTGVIARRVEELSDRRIVAAARAGNANRQSIGVLLEAIRHSAADVFGAA